MSEVVGIMQPTYLPWIGYFDMIDQVDIFVFLDDVAFEKQSWQQRNRVVTRNGLDWLTVPVFIKGLFGQEIKDVRISNTCFYEKHLKTIQQNYGRTPFFERYYPELEAKLQERAVDGSLCRLNASLIQWLCDTFGITTRIQFNSEIGAKGKRSSLLVDICQRLGSVDYLSPPGSYEYLKSDEAIFEENGIRIWIHSYEHPTYRQAHSPFVPYACAIDLLFNEGPRSLDIIRAGRRDSIPLQ